MAENTGTPVFQNHVRRLETTDPRHPDTWNPNYQTLINNDVWLKQFADEVAAARGNSASLGALLTSLASTVAATSSDMQNALLSVITYALDQAGQANYSIRALREMLQQEGEVTISNRGVVSGCICTKSTGATRNLDISGGPCFANGRLYPVSTKTNAASVPSNTGSGSAVVSAYLQYSGAAGTYVLATTTIGGALPVDSIELYRLTIPANSTDATDPQLNNVTLTDFRRLEPQFPIALSSPVNTYLPIVALSASNYRVDVDVVSAIGRCTPSMLIANSRATNGFSLRLESAADNVQVRYRVSRLKP